MGGLVAVFNRKGENATETAVTMLEALDLQNVERYGIASAEHLKINKTLEQLRTTETNSPAIVGNAFARILKEDKPQPAMLGNKALVFIGRVYSSTPLRLLAQENCDNFEQAAIEFLKRADGEYAFALALPYGIIAGRDPSGARPLYYGENENLTVLATERKALWKIGIKKTCSFAPGRIAVFSSSKISFKNVRILACPRKASPSSVKEAPKHLLKLLEKSIKKRIPRAGEIAVAFSGGLDSSIISALAKKQGANVQLIYVSLTNQKETEYAQRIAAELELPIQVCLHNEELLEKTVLKVVSLIEEPDPVKVSIAIPFFWAAQKAAKLGLKVMLAGQGADELFGGYQRYVDKYISDGKEKAEEMMRADILAMHETNLERDFKVCNFHNVELRLPFADFQIATFALGLPLESKIERANDTLRKLVLRRAADSLGLPKTIAQKPKKAIQYTTGVNDALRRLAKKKGSPVALYLQGIFRSSFNMTNDD